MTTFQHANAIETFWDWVTKHISRLGALSVPELVDALYEQLQEVDEYLGLLVGVDGDTTEVVFTAYGDTERMPLVKELVAQAPSLDWKLVAFMPPADGPFRHSDGENSLHTSSLRFDSLRSASNPNSIGIRLFVPGWVLQSPHREDTLWRLVTAIAGEELAALINYLDAGPEADSNDDHIPVADLGAYIAWARKNNTQQGEVP